MFLQLDVDEYLNRFIPQPRYERWPRWLSRFAGYRPDGDKTLDDVRLNFWVVIATFAGMVSVLCTFHFSSLFQRHLVPDLVPSWGASAILLYNAIESPLAQPRNVFFGTFMSSLIGVCLTKLWMTNPANEQFLWLCGALSVALSSAVMRLLKIVHPPAGAAAFIASISPVKELGWYYLPVQLLSSVIFIGVAIIFNNIERRYPQYWWTPIDLGKNNEEESIKEEMADLERDTREEFDHISIRIDHIHIPDTIIITEEELRVLETLQLKLGGPALRRSMSHLSRYPTQLSRQPSHISRHPSRYSHRNSH
ncbi:hypothetical protein TRVA0_017S00804 [Trichomonascus vanleenenianus]|uniref:HPP family protein n=1 Tax=Trichomonascus vanleenenianus TaxID=2268995 RepID=UPI003ECB9795